MLLQINFDEFSHLIVESDKGFGLLALGIHGGKRHTKRNALPQQFRIAHPR